MNTVFYNWPFREDEMVTLHWISSPTTHRDGSKRCNVYFRTEAGDIMPVSTAWGALPLLKIGDTYVNRKPHGKSLPVNEISISTAYAQNIEHGKAGVLIPPYSYKIEIPLLFDEQSCSFQFKGCTYYIPCMELARVFLASTSTLANQLLSSGGLEELIDLSSWQSDGHEATFDFRCETPGISRTLAQTFAAIYGNPELKNSWNLTHNQYVSRGLITTKLPKHAKIKLFYTEDNFGKKRFVYAVELLNIWPLIHEVYYGPETLVDSGKSSEKGGVANRHVPSDDSELDLTGALAKKTPFTTEVDSANSAFLARIKATRKTSKKHTTSHTKVIEQEDAEESFSVGDISGAGKKPFVSMEMREVQIDTDPDFTSFCKAIEMLEKCPDVSITDILFADLPSGKRVSRLNISPRRIRKYACVTLQKRDVTWLIIELCNKDGYSISTLFAKCTGNKEELVNKIIDKLMNSNGSWGQEYFPKHQFKTLDHYKYRSTERWAELMYNKML